MEYVVTLVGGLGGDLDPALPEKAEEILKLAGAAVRPATWLAPAVACDLPFTAGDPTRAEAALRARLADAPLDIAVQPADGRRKRLLVADMDSTIVTTETLDELADFAGLKAAIASITARSMAGEIDFAQSLRERVAMLKGLPATALAEVAARTQLTPGARTLVQTMKAYGAHTVLVSGGFTAITEGVRAACGFDEEVANRLEIEDGRLSGTVAEPILDRDAKLATLRRCLTERGLDADDACAVGDGANDIPMLEAAGLGVAFRGKPVVRAAARFRVDHGDLTALLFMQGYRAAEFRS